MSKQAIRQRLLNQRQQLVASSCAHYSDVVQDFVLASKLYAEAELLALYASIHNEVSTERLLVAALLDGKRVCYPRVDGEQVVFIEVSGAEDLKSGRFSVPEPQGQTVVLPESLDLIFVPGSLSIFMDIDSVTDSVSTTAPLPRAKMQNLSVLGMRFRLWNVYPKKSMTSDSIISQQIVSCSSLNINSNI